MRRRRLRWKLIHQTFCPVRISARRYDSMTAFGCLNKLPAHWSDRVLLQFLRGCTSTTILSA